jgi:hypothetical protein
MRAFLLAAWRVGVRTVALVSGLFSIVRELSGPDGRFAGVGQWSVVAFVLSAFAAWLDEHRTVRRLRANDLRLVILSANPTALTKGGAPLLEVEVTISNLGTPTCFTNEWALTATLAKGGVLGGGEVLGPFPPFAIDIGVAQVGDLRVEPLKTAARCTGVIRFNFSPFLETKEALRGASLSLTLSTIYGQQLKAEYRVPEHETKSL